VHGALEALDIFLHDFPAFRASPRRSAKIVPARLALARLARPAPIPNPEYQAQREQQHQPMRKIKAIPSVIGRNVVYVAPDEMDEMARIVSKSPSRKSPRLSIINVVPSWRWTGLVIVIESDRNGSRTGSEKIWPGDNGEMSITRANPTTPPRSLDADAIAAPIAARPHPTDRDARRQRRDKQP
jgi:hypothetical protein